MQEKFKGKDDIICSKTLNNIGMIYEKQGNLEKAMDYFE